MVRGAAACYPAAARSAGVSGEVLLNVTIGKNGSVTTVDVARGDAVLTSAAADAVHQWKYQPTLLNGQPAEVVTQVSVNFILAQE